MQNFNILISLKTTLTESVDFEGFLFSGIHDRPKAHDIVRLEVPLIISVVLEYLEPLVDAALHPHQSATSRQIDDFKSLITIFLL